MAKSYDIDLSDLILLKRTLTPYTSDIEVCKDIIRIDTLITNLANRFVTSDTESLRILLEDDILHLEYYKPFLPYAESILSSGIKTEETCFEPVYRKLRITNQEAVSVARDFFDEQGSFFAEPFSDFEEIAEDHLKFVDNKYDTDGGTVFLKTIGDAFVVCPNVANFTKATILIHEIEHVLDCYNNPSLFENTIIREIVPIFMEMIGSDYVAKRYGLLDDNYQRKLMLHLIVKEQALIVRDKIEMLEIAKDNFSLSDDKLLKVLLSYGFTKDDIELYLRRNLVQDFYYPIAQLIAIELYFIYMEDKKRALLIIQDIVMNANDQNIFEILSNHDIIINSSVNKYEQHLMRKIKRIA